MPKPSARPASLADLAVGLVGVADEPGVLADAASYCEERRAFFVIDAPPSAQDPAQMVAAVNGTG